jgi:predicted phage terminase large subunit-like protein
VLSVEQLQECPFLASPAALAVTDTGGQWFFAPHLRLIEKEFLDLMTGPDGRLIYNGPFRHGKSEYISHYAPAWLLLCDPDLEVVVVGYGSDFAVRFGRAVRDTVDRFGPALGIHVRDDIRAAHDWRIQGHKGGMRTYGIGGPFMGTGFDVLIIDDTIKTPAEALSPAINETNWNWFQTVAYTRQKPRAKIAVAAVRWGSNDLTGHILRRSKETGERWRHVTVPLMAEDKDPLGRPKGDLLWPHDPNCGELREASRKILEQLRGTRWFMPNCQRKADAEEGKLFHPARWPRYVELASAYKLGSRLVQEGCLTRFITVDPAATDGKGSDYTAFVVAALTEWGDVLILDVVNERWPLERIVPELAKCCRLWRPAAVGVEGQGFQRSLVLECQYFPDIPQIRVLEPQGRAKLMRAVPAILMAENGKILLPARPVPWMDDFCYQLGAFTGIGDEYDDMVDAVAYLALMPAVLPLATAAQGPCVLIPGRRDPFTPTYHAGPTPGRLGAQGYGAEGPWDEGGGPCVFGDGFQPF